MSKFVRQKWVLYTLVGTSLLAVLVTMVLIINPRLLPNSDIYTVEGDSRGLFANSNPKFDVLFGNKEDESAQWIRFESETKRSNTFNPNYQPERENIFQKVSKIFKKEEKLGIEMSLSGVKLSETSNETVEDISKGELRVEDILGTEEIETSTELYEVGRSLGELDNEQIVSKETIINENVWKGVDLEYQILEGIGLKEEIIIRDLESYMAGCEDSETGCDIPLNEFIFDLHLDPGVELHRSLVSVKDNPVGTYYFTDSKGNYLAHFLPSFAFDEGGSRTTGVELDVKETDIQGSYKVHVTLNIQWMLDPDRVYPIHIDPSIVHDDTSDFSTGIFSRLESATGPKIQLVEQELTADEHTVGLWHMNEGSENTCSGGEDICDSSSNDNDGTFSSVAFGTAKIGDGVVLDAVGDYVDLGNDNSLKIGDNPQTISAWIKTTGTLSTNYIYSSRDSSNGELSMATNSSGYLMALIGTTTEMTCSGKKVNDGEWHHISVVYDGSSLVGYVDGKEDCRDSSFSGTFNTSANKRIGTRVGSSSYALVGTIDELRVDRVARKAKEIEAFARKRPSGVFTSSSIDLTTDVTSIDDLQWTESGVSTGDGETPYSTTNMVGQWDFNETSGTTADNEGSCGASCDGTLSNMTTTGQDDGIGTGWTANHSKWGGGALMFDGADDAVTISDNTDLRLTSGGTISAWIKPSSLGESNFGRIVDKSFLSTSAVNGYMLTMDSNDRIQLRISGDTAPAYSYTGVIKYDEWNHVVGVFDNTGRQIYINGVDVTSSGGTSTNLPPDVSASVCIGNRAGGTDRTFDGVIDAVKIYTRSLSASEVLSDYNSTNIEFLTRTSTDGNTWEDWKPTTSETQIDSLDGGSNLPTCTGGTKNGDIYSFTTSGTFSCPSSVTVDVLVVGGGGSGGSHVTTGTGTGAGGGGAGGITFTQDYDVTGSTNITVTVGSGGTAPTTGSQGTDGGSSIFGSISVTGGGGGGYRYGTGRNGGSGGGGGYNQAGGTGVAGEGYNGGTGSGNNYGGAGGGGAGAVGTNSSSNYGQAGGAGTDYGSTFGTSYGASGWFGGGGGGGAHDSYTGGSGGTGGGGAGGVNANGTSATDGTGGGGGGSGDTGNKGGDGGDGIVLIKVKTAVAFAENSDMITVSDESNIKKEGTKSVKVKSGMLEADSNTIGLWHLDETGGSSAYIKDSSSNGNDGTPTGTSVANGVYGKGRVFNGTSDYINMPLSGLASSTSTITVDFCAKIDSSSNDTCVIGTSTDDASNRFNIHLPWGSSTIYWDFGNISSGGRLSTSFNSSWYEQWAHWAFVSESGVGQKIYRNGVLLASDSNVSTFTKGTKTFNIAYLVGNAYWAGEIDEFRLSSTARSLDEIYETYRAGREEYIYKTISSENVSASSKLQYDIASDRPGTYIQSTIGESAYVNHLSDSNTKGYWKFEEENGSGAYVKDSSGNGNDGTPTGTSSVDGEIGKARRFNGTSDYIATSISGEFDSTSTFTAEAWVNSDAVTQNYPGIISQSADANEFSFALGQYKSSSNWMLEICKANVGCSSVTAPVTNGEWVHVAGIYDVGDMYLIINGKIADTGTYTSGSAVAGNYVEIGRNGSSSDRYFDGIIDEVRLSDTARTATEIRQAYEIGKRTHPITIDFGASLDSTNLITGSGDTSFTIDATTKGMSEKGSGLYVGDKVIVKENYGGTEYIAQGTVATVNETTGAVTVSSWDSGGTYPTSGYTQYADVFKWQKEYIDVGNIRSDDIDAVTNIAFKLLDGSEGRNIWIDDISRSTYLTDSGGTSNVTSTVNRYIQYMAVVTTSDTNVTPYISNVTINYSADTGPSMDQVMRHGKWFNSSGEKQIFWWANTE